MRSGALGFYAIELYGGAIRHDISTCRGPKGIMLQQFSDPNATEKPNLRLAPQGAGGAVIPVAVESRCNFSTDLAHICTYALTATMIITTVAMYEHYYSHDRLRVAAMTRILIITTLLPTIYINVNAILQMVIFHPF